MKRFLCVFFAVLLSAALLSCAQDTKSNSGEGKSLAQLIRNKEDVDILMDNGGLIRLELYPDLAPITVENFLKLVDSGFYDGLRFQRVEPGFVIQGGDPSENGDNTGRTDPIKGEFSANGINNPLKHERGVVSLARANGYDTGSCQFFIVLKASSAEHLNGNYAAFGSVREGMDVVDQIVNDYVENGTIHTMVSVKRVSE